MKRLLFVLLGFLMVAVLPPVSVCWGATAGACVETVQDITPTAGTSATYPVNIKQVTLTCTGNSGDGTFPAIDIAETTQMLKGWYLYKVITDPGATKPTDNWGLTITNSNGLDVLGGVASGNRDETNTESVVPKNNSIAQYPPVLGTWTLNIAGNSVNSALLVIKLIFAR
jgi:hypothetical protein